MNTITVIGNLTKEPNLKHVGERAICELRIAVDNGRYPTTYIDVWTFGGAAYACAEYLRTGRKVCASGRLALDEWRAEDGSRRSRYAIAGRVQFLDRPRQDAAPDEDPPEPEVPAPAAAEPRAPLALAA